MGAVYVVKPDVCGAFMLSGMHCGPVQPNGVDDRGT